MDNNVLKDVSDISQVELNKLLAPLVEQELKHTSEKETLVKWEYAKANPWYFMTNFVYTLDPHHKKGEKATKQFPDWAYLKWLTETWERERLLLIAKSRQMLISWLFVGLYAWDTFSHDGRYTFFQSRKESDAGYGTLLSLLARVEFIYKHLPKIIQHQNPIAFKRKDPPMAMAVRTNSVIHAVAQDSEAPRTFTASGFLSDEMAFQEKAEKGITAAIPTLDIWGRFTGVSSANGKNFFFRVLNDIR